MIKQNKKRLMLLVGMVALVIATFSKERIFCQEESSNKIIDLKTEQLQKQEVEIYKGGKKYIPGQDAPSQKESQADNAKALMYLKTLLENMGKYLNKEQKEELQKSLLELPANYDTGNIEQFNLENFLGNYSK